MLTIQPATEYDIDGWMSLIEAVRDVFPGLESPEALLEHREAALSFIYSSCAVCAKKDGLLVGGLLYSRHPNVLCFLAVHPEYRRQHIAERMVSAMLAAMGDGEDVTVTTYREGVPEGTAARAFYRRQGFTESRLTEEFGSPVQEFILNRHDAGCITDEIM